MEPTIFQFVALRVHLGTEGDIVHETVTSGVNRNRFDLRPGCCILREHRSRREARRPVYSQRSRELTRHYRFMIESPGRFSAARFA
jgi:hypothetical protein